jgi:hypothetical protein
MTTNHKWLQRQKGKESGQTDEVLFFDGVATSKKQTAKGGEGRGGGGEERGGFLECKRKGNVGRVGLGGWGMGRRQ